jgi:hypothetical protein
MRVFTQAMFCMDCAMVIANGDTSGIENAELHLARMDVTLTGHAMIDGDADLGFCRDTCAGCGTTTSTDEWFTGWLDETV